MLRSAFALAVSTIVLTAGVLAGDSGRIVGHVVDEEGHGLPGVRVALADHDAVIDTEIDGRFILAAVPAGMHTLLLSLRDNESTYPDVSVTAGGTARIEIEVDWQLGFADTITVYSVSRNRERIVDAPAAVTTIPAEEIERRAAHGQLPKLLEFTPGAELTQNGLFDFNLNVRGFNSALNRRVLVLVDGRDPSIPILGSQAWAAFSHPLYSMQSMEFVRGPASALYGADAYNGVLNLRTKAPRDEPGGRLEVVGGTLETRRLDVSYAAPIGTHWHMRASGGVYRSEDFGVSRTTTTEYPGLPNEVVPLATDEDKIEFGSVRFDRYIGPREHLLTLETGIGNFSGIVGVTTIGRIQLLDSRNPWARANFNMPHWNFSAAYTGRDVRDQLTLSTGQFSRVDSYRVDLEAQGNTAFAGNRGRVVGGVQYRRTIVDSADSTGMQTVLNDEVDSYRTGLYTQVDYDFNSRLKGVVAARWDDSDLYDSQLSPKAALVYSPTPLQSLRLTYNQAFQSPNLAELLVQIGVAAPLDLSALEDALSGVTGGVPLGFESVPFLALGNSNLEVEEITTWELGYRGLIGRKSMITVDYYRSELENFVSTLLPQLGTSLGRVNPEFGAYEPPAELDPIARQAVLDALAANLPAEAFAIMSNNFDGSPIFATFSFTNIGRVDTDGIEVGLHHFVGKRLRLNAAYSWFDFDVREAPPENPILPNAPEHKAYAGVSYIAPRWDAAIQYRWFDEFQWLGGVFAGPVPSFGVVDLQANYAISEQWKVGVNVSNLLDNEHYEIFGGDILSRRALGQVTFNW